MRRSALAAILMVAVLSGCMPGVHALTGTAGSGRAGSGGQPAVTAEHQVAQPQPSAAPAVRQLITVIAPTHTSTYATLRAYRVSGSHRVLVFGPWTARVGYAGIARAGRKREGDGSTPSGTFRIGFFFGVQHKLAFAFPFRRAYSYDYWDDDPASPRYNLWTDVRKHDAGVSPEPMLNVPVYDYAAVIDYNMARTPGLGSAIFLHINGGGPTVGCVSLPRARLIKVLLWLKPKYHPTITIAVHARS